VLRLDTAGNLDPTFGAGGAVTTDVNPGDFAALWGLGIETVVVNGTPTPKIVASGTILTGSAGNGVVVRYNLDGSLDPTFGAGGVATAVVVQPGDGKLVIAGSTTNTPITHTALARFNGDGSLDTSFASGGTGIVALSSGGDRAEHLALQSDGKIVTAGWASTN